MLCYLAILYHPILLETLQKGVQASLDIDMLSSHLEVSCMDEAQCIGAQ